MRNTQSKTVNLQLDLDIVKQIDALARHEERSRNSIVRRIVVRALAEQREQSTSKRTKKSRNGHAQAMTV